MTKRIMQLQVLNPHARVFAIAAGRRNHLAAELARSQRESAARRSRSRTATAAEGPTDVAQHQEEITCNGSP